MNTVLFSGLIGIAAAAAVTALAHVAPRLGLQAFRSDVDAARFCGREFSRRESHVIGIFIHLVLYGCFGMFFGAMNAAGVVSVHAAPLVAYAIVLTAFIGGVIVPLEGHGLFGWHEDHWFVVDLLVMNAVWVLLFGLLLAAL